MDPLEFFVCKMSKFVFLYLLLALSLSPSHQPHDRHSTTMLRNFVKEQKFSLLFIEALLFADVVEVIVVTLSGLYTSFPVKLTESFHRRERWMRAYACAENIII